MENRLSPYVGLNPFTVEDKNFFFGREDETRNICANLRATRLTVLYGTSGVGKSSVLQAGVMFELNKIITNEKETYGQASFAAVYYKTWAGDPLQGLIEAVKAAVAYSVGIKSELLESAYEKTGLVNTLSDWSKRYNLEILIILDQFEELFTYLKDKNSASAKFAEQLAEAIKKSDLSARFLLSLRGDTLLLLDYFKGKIPGLFDNRLRLEYLKGKEARFAIEKPLQEFNPEYEVEEKLTDEVIKQVAVKDSGKIAGEQRIVEDKDKSQSNDDLDNVSVETPLLQLVMRKIWDKEVQDGSKVLHLKTFTEKLGGTDKILKTHLAEVINPFSGREKEITSDCFEFLVTPMGTKVAYTPDILAEKIGEDEKSVKDVLDLLVKGKQSNAGNGENGSQPNKREERTEILRTTEIPRNGQITEGYELKHDALAPAVLDWRKNYEIEHSWWTLSKKYLPILIGLLSILVAVIVILGGVSFKFQQKSNEAESNANKANDERKEALKEKTEAIKEKTEAVAITQNTVTNSRLMNSNPTSQTTLEQVELSNELNRLLKENIKLNQVITDLSASSKTETVTYKLDNMIKEGQVSIKYRKAILDLVNKEKAGNLSHKAVKIYFQVVDKSQITFAQKYQTKLKTEGYVVPAIEIVGLKLNKSQLRYFHQEDSDIANEIIKFFPMTIVPQYISGYGNVSSEQVEIWFAADAFSNDDNNQ